MPSFLASATASWKSVEVTGSPKTVIGSWRLFMSGPRATFEPSYSRIRGIYIYSIYNHMIEKLKGFNCVLAHVSQSAQRGDLNINIRDMSLHCCPASPAGGCGGQHVFDLLTWKSCRFTRDLQAWNLCRAKASWRCWRFSSSKASSWSLLTEKLYAHPCNEL